MSKLPRILAVTGVALGGVFAINAIAAVKGAPNLFSVAKAMAEAAPAKDKAPAKPTEVALAKPEDAKAITAAANPLVCETSDEDLAKLAGLTAGQRLAINSLSDRDADLRAREAQGDLIAPLLTAAEQKIDAKLATLNALKAEIEGMVKQADEKQAAETARMVTVYSNMKPKSAAQSLAGMKDEVRLPIAAQMKESKLALILAAMTPAQSIDLVQKLAQRNADQAEAGRAALAPPAANAPVQAGAKPATTTPAQAAAKPATTPAKPAAQTAAKPAGAPAATPPAQAPSQASAAKPATPPAKAG